MNTGPTPKHFQSFQVHWKQHCEGPKGDDGELNQHQKPEFKARPGERLNLVRIPFVDWVQKWALYEPCLLLSFERPECFSFVGRTACWEFVAHLLDGVSPWTRSLICVSAVSVSVCVSVHPCSRCFVTLFSLPLACRFVSSAELVFVTQPCSHPLE